LQCQGSTPSLTKTFLFRERISILGERRLPSQSLQVCWQGYTRRFYLSSFNPVKVLKGTFKAGRLSSLPRRLLVVAQFTISISIIIGTMIVYQQIQFAKDRPVGYSREGLLMVPMRSPEYESKYAQLRTN